MNADLEEQVKEMGPEYGALVDRLRAAKTVEPWEGRPLCRPRTRQSASLPWLRGVHVKAWLIAASLLIALGLTIHLTSHPSSLTSHPSSLTSHPFYGAHEYHLSVPEMIASQNADGSWQNDFLTRRNAEILSSCEGKAARIAYKKALRNLRSKGIF